MLLLFVFATSFSYAQSDEFELKALLVLSISEETGWTNETQIDRFEVGVIGDETLYKRLNEYSNSKNIHGKKFKVNYYRAIKDRKAEDVIVIHSSLVKGVDLSGRIGQNVLSIVEDFKTYESSCVNIFIGDNNQLEFTVNAKKFEDQKLRPSASLLVYATNKSDAIRIIDQAERELEALKEDYNSQLTKYNQLQSELKALSDEIQNGEAKIAELQADIETKEEGLLSKDKEYTALKNKMDALKSEYLNTQNELGFAFENLKTSAKQLEGLEEKLAVQMTDIESNQKILNDQEKKLEEQERALEESGAVISSTTRIIWIVVGISLLLAVILFFIYRENREKRRSLSIINKKNEEILEASMHKDEFISNLSHEVRTPLNAIIGYTNLVHEHVQDDQDKKYLEYVTLSSKNLLRIINDILDLKKIESGKLELEHEGFQLKEIVTDTFHTTELLVTQKSINYVLNYDSALPKVVVGDPIKINQVLLNLLGNAAKFTERGKIELNVRLLGETDDNVNVEFEIADTGIGISSEKIGQIFESFAQEDEEIKKKYGGTGLGLAIAKKFVNMMGGDIVVKSKQDVGTSFTFNIPFEKSVEVESSSVLESEIGKNVLSGIRIAYADDLPINRELFVRQLKGVSKDVHIEVAENGEELVQLVLNKDFDIVITDVQMPVMDGVDAAKLIRKTNRDIKIIGLSARVLKKDVQKYLEAGMNDYISKPYSLNDLVVKISEQLGLNWKVTPEGNSIHKNGNKFMKVWNISDGEEEYREVLNDLIRDIRSNLSDLENDPQNVKLAHSLLNKILYLDQNGLSKTCRDYEAYCRDGERVNFGAEVQKLSSEIGDFLSRVEVK